MLGYVADVPALLNAVDMVLVPSRWEGFGLAAAEAMAAGRPVVATRVAGLEDLIDHGQTGLLIERGSVVALAEAIVQLAGDAGLRERLGAAARRHVATHYPIGRNIAAYERLYEQVVSNP